MRPDDPPRPSLDSRSVRALLRSLPRGGGSATGRRRADRSNPGFREKKSPEWLSQAENGVRSRFGRPGSPGASYGVSGAPSAAPRVRPIPRAARPPRRDAVRFCPGLGGVRVRRPAAQERLAGQRMPPARRDGKDPSRHGSRPIRPLMWSERRRLGRASRSWQDFGRKLRVRRARAAGQGGGRSARRYGGPRHGDPRYRRPDDSHPLFTHALREVPTESLEAVESANRYPPVP
jgi:hypothetical protein